MGLNDGGPAFPVTWTVGGDLVSLPGMTLRDWFAGMLLPEEYRRVGADPSYTNTDIADECYAMADAMIVARAKRDA